MVRPWYRFSPAVVARATLGGRGRSRTEKAPRQDAEGILKQACALAEFAEPWHALQRMRSLGFSLHFGAREVCVLRQSRFWTAQLFGWLLILPLYFRESIELGIRLGLAPLTFLLTAMGCGIGIACSTALAAAYLGIPPRWLTGARAVPIAFGLSLLGALPYAGGMTLLVADATSIPIGFRRGYAPWAFFHASILMMGWSGAFLWFIRGDRTNKARPRVAHADVSSPEAKSLDTTHADPVVARMEDPNSSSATERISVPWGLDAKVRLREGLSEKFCQVKDIAYIRAADNYTEVHLSNGHVALVKERLRDWELRLPEPFVRIHRSTLINLDLSEELVYSDGAWRLRVRGCSETLSVSRRLVRALKTKLDARQGRISTG